MRPVFSITFAYHFGQVLKLCAFALIVYLFDYAVLGESALYLAYSLIIGGAIDLGTRYTCWTEVKEKNLDQACTSKILFSVCAAGILYGLFSATNYYFDVIESTVLVGICFISGTLNFGNLDWFIIRKYSPAYFLSVVFAYNISPIVLILTASFLENGTLAVIAFPLGYAVSGFLVLLVSNRISLPKLSLFPIRSLLNNALLVPGQHIFMQAFIPLLGNILKLESLGQLKMLSVLISSGVAAATFIVLGSYKAEKLRLSVFNQYLCSALFCVLILVPLVALGILDTPWHVELFGFDISLLLRAGCLAVLLAVLSYEQERLIFKGRQVVSLLILYGYPAFLALLVLLSASLEVSRTLEFGLHLMTLSSLIVALPIAHYRNTEVSNLLFSPWFAKFALLITLLIDAGKLVKLM